MVDKEKVIKGLEYCTNGGFCFSDCPYFKEVPMTDGKCITALQADALELLKEQEPVRVGKKIKAGDVALDFYQCGYCKNAIRKPWRYCPFCGMEVKWE